MKLLYCGDVMGRSGREAIIEYVPKLKSKFSVDVVVVNGENAAGGFGITEKIAHSFFECGVDIITTGNHVWKKKEVMSFISREKRLLRPMNYSNPGLPGTGVAAHLLPNGRHFIVMHGLARLYMPDLVDCPFRAVDEVLKTVSLQQQQIAGIMMDFHGEASSEKMAMGHHLNGRASFVVGSHTHIPTADHQILSQGTAYLTDGGMCGDYDSVIGMNKNVPLGRFLGHVITDRMEPATGPATLCGALVEIDDKTGKANDIAPVRVGGRLSQTHDFS